MVTIKDIAQMANVSRGTVDRVLHGRPGVNPEIASQVIKIATELGYQPNRAGKMLASRKRPHRIGCLIPSVGNPFFDDVIQGMKQAETEYSDLGFSVLIQEVKGFQVDTHLRALDSLVEAGCDALCLTTVDVEPIRNQINELTERGIKIVTVNSDITGVNRLCYVGSDYRKCGLVHAGLLSLLCQKPLHILVVTGSSAMYGHSERIMGIVQGLEQQGNIHSIVTVVEGFDDNEISRQVTVHALSEHPEINAVFIAAAGVDGVLEAIDDRNILIFCCDETPQIRRYIEARRISWTICQEPVRQGYQAIRKVADHFIYGIMPEDLVTENVIKIKENC